MSNLTYSRAGYPFSISYHAGLPRYEVNKLHRTEKPEVNLKFSPLGPVVQILCFVLQKFSPQCVLRVSADSVSSYIM